MYKYKFIKGNKIIEAVGCNIWSAAEDCGIRITKALKLSKWYLQETKFEDRVRTVWGIKNGEMQSSSYQVHQTYNR
jgi:hypothetical protein